MPWRIHTIDPPKSYGLVTKFITKVYIKVIGKKM